METISRRENSRKGQSSQSTAAELARELVVFLAANPDRLTAMLGETGIEPATLRTRIDEDAFCRGLLDYASAHEEVLVAWARFAGEPPEHLTATLARLQASTLP